MNKLISVIVPVYGTEAYLDKCIESITGQTYQNLEIILVDDGSPDNCPAICDRWAEVDSRIKVIHKINGGVSSARNIGIDVASGDFLGFVDSDDWITGDLFERIMKLFDAFDPDIVTFGCNRVNEKGEVYATTENIKEGFLSPEKAVEELLKGNINSYPSNKVYKKQVFSGIRFPDGRVWEDLAIIYKLFLNAKSIYCYPVPLLFYYARRNSITMNVNETALANIFLAQYERHLEVKDRLPSLQMYSLPRVALSALRLYDRSLWKKVDEETLKLAKMFLEQNKETILSTAGDKKYWLYYKFPHVYAMVRIFRHRVGTMIKRF